MPWLGATWPGSLNDFFKDNSPFSVDGSVTRVEISSVIPQGGETYQVSWVETKAKPGAAAVAEHWKAVVTVGFDAKLAENPESRALEPIWHLRQVHLLDKRSSVKVSPHENIPPHSGHSFHGF
jgi:hypothetical protein